MLATKPKLRKDSIKGKNQIESSKHQFDSGVDYIAASALMAGKVYLTEEEYRTAILRRNETRKSFSGIFTQLGTVLIAGAVAQWYSEGELKLIVGGWFLLAGLLILLGMAFLRGLQSES